MAAGSMLATPAQAAAVSRFAYVGCRTTRDAVRAASASRSSGWKPRFFTLDPTGELLYAANQNSDSIVAFRVDAETGALAPTGQVIATASPVCIVFSTGAAS